MNDILVNWDKIKKGMPSVNQTSNDRIPEISEINTLLNYNDIRIRPIILDNAIIWNSCWCLELVKMEKCYSDRKRWFNSCSKMIVYYQEPEQYNTYITSRSVSFIERLYGL